MKIWPWTEFDRLAGKLEDERRVVDALYRVIWELDPLYWSREVNKLHYPDSREYYVVKGVN
jgi:hypothetical protein